MSWSQHLRSAQDFLSVGDEIECVILNIDREDRKMSLGLKQLKQDPQAEYRPTLPGQLKAKGHRSQLHEELRSFCRALKKESMVWCTFPT